MKLSKFALSLLFVFALLGCAVMGVAASPAEADGTHAMQEALALFQATTGRQTVTVAQAAAWDFNHDGRLTVRDTLLLYKDASGRAPLAQQALTFETTAINSWVSAPPETPPVITTAEQWQAFRAAYRGSYQPFAYFGEITVPENAIIPVQAMQTDAYIAAVSADDTTVYVALVTLEVDGTMTTESNRWLLVEADPAAVQGKTVVVTRYTDTATLCVAQNTAVYTTTVSADHDCGYNHTQPLVFATAEEQAAYLAAHENDIVDASAYDPYDADFYEDYVLVELYAAFGTPSLNLKPEYLLVTSDAVYVSVSHTVYNEPVMAVMEFNHVLIPVSRDVYQDQPIVAQLTAYAGF